MFSVVVVVIYYSLTKLYIKSIEIKKKNVRSSLCCFEKIKNRKKLCALTSIAIDRSAETNRLQYHNQHSILRCDVCCCIGMHHSHSNWTRCTNY